MSEIKTIVQFKPGAVNVSYLHTMQHQNTMVSRNNMDICDAVKRTWAVV
jgi:hypothetical protein